MPWLQLIVDIGDQNPQPLETALFSMGALAVTLHDAADQPVFEPAPGETLLWKDVRLVALFDDKTEPGKIREQLRALLNANELPAHRFESLADREWEREWLKDFRPMKFGRRLWVCPDRQIVDEHAGEPHGAAVTIQLDPGLAFGSGTHPTTALCLAWLDEAVLATKTVMDYGCGSGILAVAAAKLGAARVIATDIDPQALKATRDNAAKNDVLNQIEIAAPDRVAGTACDIVLANILADTLIDLANQLSGLLTNGGVLIMSGILDDQADTVMQTYCQWFDMLPPRSVDGWSLLVGLRKN